MSNRKVMRLKFLSDMAIATILLFLTFTGYYCIMVYILKISRGASLVVLIPSLLICFPALLYRFYLRYKKYSESHVYSYKTIFAEKNLGITIPSMIAYSLIMIFALLGLYFLIYLSIPIIAMICFGIAAYVSIIIIKKYQKFLKKNPNPAALKQKKKR